MKRNAMPVASPLLCVAILLTSACDQREPSEPASVVQTAGHGHPEGLEECFICEPSLRDEGRLWCGEHGRYEDRCWLCHPELEDSERLYCDEHKLYEDECFLCDPARGGNSSSDASGLNDVLPRLGQAADAGGLYCLEHDVAEAECAICHPDLATTLEVGQTLKIRFASAEGPRKAGIQTTSARTAVSSGVVEGLAESRLNANQMARVTPVTTGVIRRVLVDVGQHVTAGDALVEVHSSEVATAKALFLTALVDLELASDTLRRESVLREENISAEQDYQAANATYRRARIDAATSRQQLSNLGLREEEIETVAATEDSSAVFVLRAPFDGEIVAREAVAGESISPGDHLLSVADRSSIWIELSIDASVAGKLEIGALVEARFDALPDVLARGELSWIGASIDPRSRLLGARAVVRDPDPRLRAGHFGRAQITVAAPEEVVRVPRSAIQHVGGRPFVFVRASGDLFEARAIALAGMNDQEADILAGVAPGEPVVVSGAFTVMSEMLKARLGAGCVH